MKKDVAERNNPLRGIDDKREYIDVTPTWAGLMPFFINVLESPNVGKGAKEKVKKELMRLAKEVDKVNNLTK